MCLECLSVKQGYVVNPKTWQVYSNTNGSNMLTAIDQTLQRSEYGTTLANEFPKFTWNNYFMITGTYDTVLPGRVYADLYDPFNTNRQMVGFHDNAPEWQVFRNRLVGGRENYQVENAGVLVDRVGQIESYPIDGPAPGKPFFVESLGSAYVEFFPTTLPLTRTADLTITVSLKVYSGGTSPKVSIIPISNFSATPHPANNFATPVITPEGTYLVYKYAQTVQNFRQLNHVAVIISNPSNVSTAIPFSYRAEVTFR